MNIVSVVQVSQAYGEKTLLRDVTFGVEETDRIGLIGVNGTGKSTLLKMLAGVGVPESGTVVIGKGVTVHYLPQDPVLDADRSVIEEVFAGDLPVMQLLREYETVVGRLEMSPGDDKLQRRLLTLHTRLDEAQAWQLDHEAKAILTRLGILDFHRKVGELSGGQRKRVAMARALIQPADVLILDEPTNHIDDETVSWLESHLQTRRGALVMVTHDRYFLDRVVNRIFELDGGRLFEYPGNYEKFLEGKLAREASELASEEKRQNFLRNEIEWIRKGPRARGTKQKARTERYYDTLENGPLARVEQMDVSTASSRLGKSVIELDDVMKAYAERTLFHDVNVIISRADRVGIIGPNGRGKSTLLRLMAGLVTPDHGKVTIGQTVRFGYYDQELAWPEDVNIRVIDWIKDVATMIETTDGSTITAAQMLERFLFPPNLQWTPIGQLSGGERRRLALLRILMTSPNVLLLDEPTNDLDIPTLEILESYLIEFPGAVVTVSHDRYFLDKVANRIFSFEGNGEIVRYTGNFTDYMEYRATMEIATPDAAKESDSPARSLVPERKEPEHSRQRQAVRMTFQEKRDMERIDDDIAVAEAEQRRIEHEMVVHATNHVELQRLVLEQQANEVTLTRLLDRWTYLMELAEKVNASKLDVD